MTSPPHPIQLINLQAPAESSRLETDVSISDSPFTQTNPTISSTVFLKRNQILRIKQQLSESSSYAQKLLDDNRSRKQVKAAKTPQKIKTKKSSTVINKYHWFHMGCYYSTSRRWNLYRHEQTQMR